MNSSEKRKLIINKINYCEKNGRFSLEKEFENSLGCIYANTYFDIIEKDLNKTLDRTLKYIAVKELDTEEKTEFPEVLKEYEEYANSIKDYSDIAKYSTIEESEVLSSIKDLEFSNDFQNAGVQTALFSSSYANGDGFYVTAENLWQAAVVFTVRRIFPHTWLNHNDQFLQPDKPLGEEFINDCLVWMLFSGKNLTA